MPNANAVCFLLLLAYLGISEQSVDEYPEVIVTGTGNEERANKMKEEFSRKIDILIQMWSEDEEKRLKEKLVELCSKEVETEEDILGI